MAYDMPQPETLYMPPHDTTVKSPAIEALLTNTDAPAIAISFLVNPDILSTPSLFCVILELHHSRVSHHLSYLGSLPFLTAFAIKLIR